MKISPKMKFLLTNGFKGILWLVVLCVAYIMFEEYVMSKNPEVWIERFYSQPFLIYLIYFGSESFIGLFPPELFMLWALNKGGLIQYVLHVVIFAGVSFGLGYVNYLVGRYFFKKGILNSFRKRHFSQTWSQLRRYGLF